MLKFRKGCICPFWFGSAIFSNGRARSLNAALHFRDPRLGVGFRVNTGGRVLHIAYLDEFGHIGPYVSRFDKKHKTHPVFGLAGIVIPANKTREFSMFFFQLKNTLLRFEIERDGVRPAKWEKKGAALFTTTNVLKYRELRSAMNRILLWLEREGGFVFYYGVEKRKLGQVSKTPENLYQQVLNESINRIGKTCGGPFYMVLDEQGEKFRERVVLKSAGHMFGSHKARNLMEPPMQVESHLYQTVQCADWICGLLGRLSAYQIDADFEEFSWAEKYFADRIEKVSSIYCDVILTTPIASVSLEDAEYVTPYLISPLDAAPDELYIPSPPSPEKLVLP